MYREAIVDIASELIGSPSIKYVSGSPELGQSPETGFDCSGFVGFVLREAGLYIPDYTGQDGVTRPIRHCNELWDSYGVTVHDGLHDTGDLIFFSRRGIMPTHIGILLDKEVYVHAPGKDGTNVTVKEIRAEAIDPKPGYRQLYLRNPIGFKSPTLPIDNPTYRQHQMPV